MVILEKPYISEMLIDYLEESSVPVLKNNFTGQLLPNSLNLKSGNDFAAQYRRSGKIYTVSEHALDWVCSTLNDRELNRQTALLKNKVAFREACSHIYPNFFFRKFSYAELFAFDASALLFPLVLKPSVGFLSKSVYALLNESDWKEALREIRKSVEEEVNTFPETVVGNDVFILETYIQGKEFAVDLYFRNSEPVIINIFEHPFSSDKDVSDRLYFTSKEIFDNCQTPFTEYMCHLNRALNLENIPVHIELRVDGNNIMPIEINPLRFAGMCLNELSFYLTGKHPLEFYFSDTAPDYKSMWEGKEDETYCFSILEKPESSPRNELDTASIVKIYSDILEIRPVKNPDLDIQAFIFSKTSDKKELENILTLKI